MAGLTGPQRERLTQIMQQRRATLMDEICAVLSQTGEHPYSELAGSVADAADEAVADLLIDVDNAMVARDAREVRDIEAAFARMAAGDYGVCSACDQPIELARLHACPTARRCQRCQTQYDKTHGHDATPTL